MKINVHIVIGKIKMKTNLLSKHIFFNNCFYKNELTKPFFDYYFNNCNHKYEMFFTYVFGLNRIIEIIKNNDYLNKEIYFCKKDSYNKIDNNFFNKDGSLNFNNDLVKLLIKKYGYLYVFIGEFNYKNLTANLFLNITDDNFVNGFAIDLDENDPFFKSFQKYKMFLNSGEVIFSETILENILKYSKMCS